MFWLWVSAILMTATAMIHSILGERRLIGPILALNTGIVAAPLSGQVLRYAWHVTSVLMLTNAALVVWPGAPKQLIGLVGAVWLSAGLLDAVLTRGKHVGWPFLALAGLFAVLGGVGNQGAI